MQPWWIFERLPKYVLYNSTDKHTQKIDPYLGFSKIQIIALNKNKIWYRKADRYFIDRNMLYCSAVIEDKSTLQTQ